MTRKEALIRIAQEHMRKSDETLSPRQMAEIRRLRDQIQSILLLLETKEI